MKIFSPTVIGILLCSCLNTFGVNGSHRRETKHHHHHHHSSTSEENSMEVQQHGAQHYYNFDQYDISLEEGNVNHHSHHKSHARRKKKYSHPKMHGHRTKSGNSHHNHHRKHRKNDLSDEFRVNDIENSKLGDYDDSENNINKPLNTEVPEEKINQETEITNIDLPEEKKNPPDQNESENEVNGNILTSTIATTTEGSSNPAESGETNTKQGGENSKINKGEEPEAIRNENNENIEVTKVNGDIDKEEKEGIPQKKGKSMTDWFSQGGSEYNRVLNDYNNWPPKETAGRTMGNANKSPSTNLGPVPSGGKEYDRVVQDYNNWPPKPLGRSMMGFPNQNPFNSENWNKGATEYDRVLKDYNNWGTNFM